MEVPDDGRQDGFASIAALQTLSDGHLRGYIDVAAALAEQLMLDTTRRRAVLGCEPTTTGCLDTFIKTFGRLSYRRALTAEESTGLQQKAIAVGRDQLDRFRYVMEALLSSPSFLFRVEIGDGAPLAALTATELASRLSFTLWGRGPSADLLARAEAGELDTPAGLLAVAQQMAQDPRAQVFFQDFFRQWLNFESLRTPPVPPRGWSPALIPDMIAESDRLLAEHAFTPGANFAAALTANHTYVTPALAAFYGLPAGGSSLAKVTIPAGHHRQGTGLLTHAALISPKTDADLISSRGHWVRAALLCQRLDPPSNLAEIIEADLAGLSYPEVIARRNSAAGCANCHALLDPIGVGFVAYDAVGAYDARVSPSDFGIVPRFEGAANPEFASLGQLAQEIARSPEFAECVVRKVFVYTQGREPGAQDACVVGTSRERFVADGYRFGGILPSFVESPSFRQRRAPL